MKTARPPKDIRVLVRPGLHMLDASVQGVDAEGLLLLLDAPVEMGAVLAVQAEATPLTDSRILSARVVWCVERDAAWLASCRFSAPLSQRELKQFLG